jgi:ribose transport system ATP-binding protein
MTGGGAGGKGGTGGAGKSHSKRPGLLVDFPAARALVEAWRIKIGIRGASVDAGILSLSGGNQQKVLFARALASNADLILMDDPTRGVDVGTKREIYQLVRDEATKGRTFVWYTTENDELAYCDRTFVFRAGLVTRVLHSDECTEEALLAASFQEHAA